MAALGLLLLASAEGCRKREIVVRFDQQHIQAAVSSRFPIIRQEPFATITLANPRIVLQSESDRIGCRLDVSVAVPIIGAYVGQVALSGKPWYRADQKAFYLGDPKLDELNVAGLRPELLQLARARIEFATAEMLRVVPVYELKGRDAKEITAAYLLRSVVIRDGRLEATLALAP